MKYNPYTLENKTILITGASSGIGRCTAIECSKNGAQLIITGRNQTRLEDTFNQLFGDNHLMITSDLTDENQIEELVKSLACLDGVFFCAGITDTTLVKFMKKDKINNVFDINFISPVILTRYLITKKKLNRNASLVYMSSLGAEQITLGLGIYSASKLALNGIVHAVAQELISKKIRANSIMPMMVKTELVENIDTLSAEQLLEDEKKYPLGYGKPEDIAYAAMYFLSDASKWVTGCNFKMDGGSTL